MNNHILRYSTAILFTLLLGGCDKYERTEVLHEIYVNKSAINGFIGQEVQLTASPQDGTYSFQWMSENPEVATVTNSGMVKLIGEGSTIIVLSAGEIKQRVEISSSRRIPVVDIILSDTSIELIPQAKKNITVQLLPENANDIPKAEWSSENDKVAIVSEKGEITGVAEGTTNITYKVGDLVKKIKVLVSYTSPFNGPHILKAGSAVEIMAADFDFGGMGRAFQDDVGTALNNDSYRRGKGDVNSLPVEIEGPGTNIGFINNGEWYQYTIDVKEAGDYLLHVSLSAAGASKYHIEVDNINVTGSIDVASNGSWSNWMYHPSKAIKLNLTQGNHKIKFFAEQASFNFRALRFSKE
jgi:hypothetical protein